MDLDGNLVDALKHLYTSMEDFFDKDSGCNFGKWKLVTGMQQAQGHILLLHSFLVLFLILNNLMF